MSDFMVSLWESIFTPGPTPALLIATNATFGALQLLLFILLVFTYSIHFFILSILCGGLWFSINWFARELAAVKAQEQAKSGGSTGGDGGKDDTGGSSSAISGTTGPGSDGGGSGVIGGSGSGISKRSKDAAKRRKSPEPGSDTETETPEQQRRSQKSTTGSSPTSPRKAAPAPASAPAPMPDVVKEILGRSGDNNSSATTTANTGRGSQAATSVESSGLLVPRPQGQEQLSEAELLRRRRSLGDSSGYVSTDSEWEKVSEGEGKK